MPNYAVVLLLRCPLTSTAISLSLIGAILSVEAQLQRAAAVYLIEP